MGHITENATKQISEAFGRRLKDTGVTRIQWIALYNISKYQPISQRELSVLMSVQDSSATRLLERMERDGLIERFQSEVDKRVIMVQLTALGEETFERLLPYGDAFNNDLVAGISEKELIIFENVLQQMIQNISKNQK